MKLLAKLSLIFLVTIIFIGCGSDDKTTIKKDTRICPQCNMPLPDNNIHTSKMNVDGDTVSFDDVGCMILWSKKKHIDLKKQKIKIFSNDTKRYIDPYKGYFRFDEKTPMLYGFSAYEKKCQNCISFDEVITRMLRGEHIANPKIRKQILGY